MNKERLTKVELKDNKVWRVIKSELGSIDDAYKDIIFIKKSGNYGIDYINYLVNAQLNIIDIYTNQWNIENLQADDRLIELPCKIGGTIYRINVRNVKEDGSTIFRLVYKIVEEEYTKLHISSGLGKDVFFTRAEAEKRLKELEGNYNE